MNVLRVVVLVGGDRDDDEPSRHPHRLGQGPLWGGQVLQHLEERDHVDAVVGKGQAVDVHDGGGQALDAAGVDRVDVGDVDRFAVEGQDVQGGKAVHEGPEEHA